MLIKHFFGDAYSGGCKVLKKHDEKKVGGSIPMQASSWWRVEGVIQYIGPGALMSSLCH